MTKLFNDLSSDQKAKFEAKCRSFGIDPATVPKTLTTENGGKGVVLGHPAANAAIAPAKIINVANIQELSKYGGCQDEEYIQGRASDAFVRYPQPLATLSAPSLTECGGDVCKLKDSMTLEHHEAVNQAMHAYMMGNSSKVKDYEEHINAIHFPMQMAVYAAEDKIITNNNPLIIDTKNGGPTTLVYGTVTVEEGGYILVKTPLSLDAQAFTSQNT
ncbi:hypothetical protein CSZ94_12035 [Janthinobacterium sp. ROICE36]|uniref:hypothetical protein n=1 Tax=Janthinobacterium sp. ROICE36 TaxID=2048670 RepID=UPI000C7F619B|nr:hypothetical protein [Janthinobacterium sp. ROICE36]PLY42104.1 hypothetical protein CSZ94_12035 [Janthinobacterium sp. ROICE36]